MLQEIGIDPGSILVANLAVYGVLQPSISACCIARPCCVAKRGPVGCRCWSADAELEPGMTAAAALV